MAVQKLDVAPQKALEAILYIVSKLEKPDLHEVLKIRYFADKLHLAKYGFQASGDRYVAMEFGPVASKTYDLLKVARGNGSAWATRNYADLICDSLKVENGKPHRVYASRPANTDYLSASDMEAIDQAVAESGGMDFGARTKLSHDSAYDAAWAMAQQRKETSYPMHLKSIAGALENADEVLGYLAA